MMHTVDSFLRALDEAHKQAMHYRCLMFVEDRPGYSSLYLGALASGATKENVLVSVDVDGLCRDVHTANPLGTVGDMIAAMRLAVVMLPHYDGGLYLYWVPMAKQFHLSPSLHLCTEKRPLLHITNDGVSAYKQTAKAEDPEQVKTTVSEAVETPVEQLLRELAFARITATTGTRSCWVKRDLAGLFRCTSLCGDDAVLGVMTTGEMVVLPNRIMRINAQAMDKALRAAQQCAKDLQRGCYVMVQPGDRDLVVSPVYASEAILLLVEPNGNVVLNGEHRLNDPAVPVEHLDLKPFTGQVSLPQPVEAVPPSAIGLPITAEWLKEVGFRTVEVPRQTEPHYLLWIGRMVDDDTESLGVELGVASEGRWHCWIRADYDRRRSRFLHVRYLKQQGDVYRLISGLTGLPLNLQNIRHGELLPLAQRERYDANCQRLDQQIARETAWYDHEKDATRAGVSVGDRDTAETRRKDEAAKAERQQSSK